MYSGWHVFQRCLQAGKALGKSIGKLFSNIWVPWNVQIMAWSHVGTAMMYDHFWQIGSLAKLAVTLQLTTVVNSANIHNDMKLVNLFWKKTRTQYLTNQYGMRLLNRSHTGTENGKWLSNLFKQNLDQHNFGDTLSLLSPIPMKMEVSLLVNGIYTIGEGNIISNNSF